MDAKEFEQYIKCGTIERVTLYRPTPSGTWLAFAYGEDLPSPVVNAIEVAKNGGPRSWQSLDDAHAFIRKAGFQQIIEIDTSHAS